jgi:hypothetical protein
MQSHLGKHISKREVLRGLIHPLYGSFARYYWDCHSIPDIQRTIGEIALSLNSSKLGAGQRWLHLTSRGFHGAPHIQALLPKISQERGQELGPPAPAYVRRSCQLTCAGPHGSIQVPR